ncbi:response regulator [Desulfovibrio sp. OttesenSCG-928-I05]|nr:response regulator [Desulfovibrio sp. OttesenSCG-928-I05]
MEKLYIVCVDDQREVLASVVRDLNMFADWAVMEECESADEAEELMEDLAASDRPVALIVCDHIMPGMNGVDFLATLAADQRFPHLKKILLTGQATQKDTIEAVNKARIDYYLEKPWSAKELEDVVRLQLSHYLFDSGRFSMEYRALVTPSVLMERMQGRE